MLSLRFWEFFGGFFAYFATTSYVGSRIGRFIHDQTHDPDEFSELRWLYATDRIDLPTFEGRVEQLIGDDQ